MLRKLARMGSFRAFRINRLSYMGRKQEWEEKIKEAKESLKSMGENLKKKYEEQDNKHDFNRHFNDRRLLFGLVLLTYCSYRLKQHLNHDDTISHKTFYQLLQTDQVSSVSIESSTFIHG